MDKKSNIKHILLSKIKKFELINPKIDSDIDKLPDEAAFKINNGADLIILKSTFLNSSELVKIGFKLRQLCSMFDVLFMVESRADIAKIVEADGIILSDLDYSLEYAKKILDNDKLFGYLVDNIKQNSIDGPDFYISYKNMCLNLNPKGEDTIDSK